MSTVKTPADLIFIGSLKFVIKIISALLNFFVFFRWRKFEKFLLNFSDSVMSWVPLFDGKRIIRTIGMMSATLLAKEEKFSVIEVCEIEKLSQSKKTKYFLTVDDTKTVKQMKIELSSPIMK
jgi:hypothetical protein